MEVLAVLVIIGLLFTAFGRGLLAGCAIIIIVCVLALMAAVLLIQSEAKYCTDNPTTAKCQNR